MRGRLTPVTAIFTMYCPRIRGRTGKTPQKATVMKTTLSTPVATALEARTRAQRYLPTLSRHQAKTANSKGHGSGRREEGQAQPCPRPARGAGSGEGYVPTVDRRDKAEGRGNRNDHAQD